MTQQSLSRGPKRSQGSCNYSQEAPKRFQRLPKRPENIHGSRKDSTACPGSKKAWCFFWSSLSRARFSRFWSATGASQRHPRCTHGLHKGKVSLDYTTGIAVLGGFPWDCSPGIAFMGLFPVGLLSLGLCSTWITLLGLLCWDLSPGTALLGLLYNITFWIQINPIVWGLALG